MSPSRRIAIGIAAAAIVGLGGFAAYRFIKAGADRPTGAAAARSAAQLAKIAATAPVFQPEAAMLTQAINATGTAKGEIPGPANTASPPADPPPATSTPYVYKSGVCPASVGDVYGCLVNYYRSTTQNYGVNIAIRDIEQRYNEDAEVATQCHPLMHIIGQVAATLYPTISDAYLHGDNFCWSGYYHGVLEGVVFKIGLKNLPGELNNICANIPGKSTYDFEYYNCVHGLGHGIMEALDDNVPSSLAMCDGLTGTWEDESCYSGVFMENIISFDHDGTSDWLKPDDLLYPCDAVADKYKSECYLGQTSYALQQTNYNFGRIFALCATVAEPYRDICNQSMGRDIANQAGHQAQGTKDSCWITTDANDRANCVIGAAKEIISYYASDTQAIAFCNVLDDANKATCLSTTASYYASF